MVVRYRALFFQRFFDIVANAADLAGAFTGAYNKIVREAASFTDIQ
jgi:hypothetical protein